MAVELSRVPQENECVSDTYMYLTTIRTSESYQRNPAMARALPVVLS